MCLTLLEYFLFQHICLLSIVLWFFSALFYLLPCIFADLRSVLCCFLSFISSWISDVIYFCFLLFSVNPPPFSCLSFNIVSIALHVVSISFGRRNFIFPNFVSRVFPTWFLVKESESCCTSIIFCGCLFSAGYPTWTIPRADIEKIAQRRSEEIMLSNWSFEKGMNGSGSN